MKQFLTNFKTEMDSSGKITLSWTDFTINVPETFRNIWRNNDFIDVTLVTSDQKHLQAHKLVLGAASQFFRDALLGNPHTHPLIYLKDVTSIDLELILQFIYIGECQVPHESVERFLTVGRQLLVRGLVGEAREGREVVWQSDANIINQACLKQESQISNLDGQTNENRSEENVDNIGLVGEANEDIEADEAFFELTNFKREADKKQFTVQIRENNLTAKKDSSIDASLIKTQDKVICKECGKRITNNLLPLHMIKHSGKIKKIGKIFSCNECGSTCQSRSMLQIHIGAKHLNIKYQCDQCDFISRYNHDLRRHKDIKHNGKKYNCVKCDHQVLTKKALKVHQIRRHEEIQEHGTCNCKKCKQAKHNSGLQ